MRRIISGIKENFGLVATFLGFVVDTITLLTLFNNNNTSNAPAFDSVIQLTIWAVALITLLGFLRYYWIGLSRKPQIRPEATFGKFLLYDYILRFKHPFLLIPVVILVGTFLEIIVKMGKEAVAVTMALISSGIMFAIIAAAVVLANRQEERQQASEWDFVNNDKNFQVWKERINKILDEKGYVTSRQLSHEYTDEHSLCIKALKRFHHLFEVSRDLVFINTSRSTWNGSHHQEIRVYLLTYRNLLKQEPWADDKYWLAHVI